jgi:hypothetical protein
MYFASHNQKREDAILAYTCCHKCFHDHPHAVTFRQMNSRRSQSAWKYQH